MFLRPKSQRQLHPAHATDATSHSVNRPAATVDGGCVDICFSNRWNNNLRGLYSYVSFLSGNGVVRMPLLDFLS